LVHSVSASDLTKSTFMLHRELKIGQYFNRMPRPSMRIRNRSECGKEKNKY